MTYKLSIWSELAKQIAKNMLDPKKVFPEHRENLEKDVEEIINKFVSERIARCYFMVSKSEINKIT